MDRVARGHRHAPETPLDGGKRPVNAALPTTAATIQKPPSLSPKRMRVKQSITDEEVDHADY
jgi:hypothetical protein